METYNRAPEFIILSGSGALEKYEIFNNCNLISFVHFIMC